MRRSDPFGQMSPLTISVVAGAAAMSVIGDRPLVDAVVVMGLGVVAPLALGAARSWTVAAVAAAIAMVLEPGPVAAMLVLPALVVAVSSVVAHLRRAGVHDLRSIVEVGRSLDAIAYALAPTWATVAVVSLLASVSEVELFGIGEPIVRLTAVHYFYAGVGALTIARRLAHESTRFARLGFVAVVATAAAPPIVAAGFVLGHPIPQIGGAALMTIGVWSSAVLLLASATRSTGTIERVLRVAGGLTPWAPMILAMAWATAQHVAGTPALSVPDMARLHGLANGIGFVLLGLVATRGSVLTPGIGSHVEASA